jgi:Flp pilus assembly protein TadG
MLATAWRSLARRVRPIHGASACPGEVDPVRRSRTCANKESTALPVSRRLGKRCKLLMRRDDGAAAVEFAMVAAPFIALLVALIQTALVFFAGRVLDVVVTESSRQILTGSAQTSGMTQSGFATAVCQNVFALFKCSQLMIDVRTYSSFGAADTSMPTLTFDAHGNVTNSWQFNPGNPNDIVVVRVMYQWPVALGPLGFNLSNMSNGNRLMVGTAVFKNEPY